MNISRIIKYANFYRDGLVSDKIGRKMLKDIENSINNCNLDDKLYVYDRKFYEKCIKNHMNTTDKKNHMSDVFLAAIIAIMEKENFRIKEFEKITFEQGIWKKKLCDGLENVMIKINNQCKCEMYIKYKENYYKENRRGEMFDYTKSPKMLTKEQWNIDIANEWVEELGGVILDLGELPWQIYKETINQELKDKLEFKITEIELVSIHYYKEILEKILEDIRVKNKFEEVEMMLDAIIDGLDELPEKKKQEVLDIHKNKIKALYVGIKETLNKIRNEDSIEDKKIYTKNLPRLSRSETLEYYMEKIEKLLED